MRMVIQRVKEGSVVINKEVFSSIKKGLVVFLGIHQTDTLKSIPYLVRKLIQLRIFPNEEGKMDKSVQDIQGEILIVSQFTLYGCCKKGCRPDFLQAASPQKAKPLYEAFLEKLIEAYPRVRTGVFQEKMEVSLINDGPVTLTIENP